MQREVDMAVRDKDGKLTVGRQVMETEVVHVHHNGQGADRVLNDIIAGRVLIARNSTVTVELSKSGANDLRRSMEAGGGVLELVETPA